MHEPERLRERADAVAEVDRLQQLVAERDAEREQIFDEWVRTEVALKDAESARNNLESTVAELRQQVNEVAGKSVRAEVMQNELASVEEALDEQARELAASQSRQLDLQYQLEEQNRRVSEAEKRAADAEAARAALEGRQFFDEVVDVRDASVESLVARLRELLPASAREDGGETGPQEQIALPAPGQPWPYARGVDVWMLSGHRRKLMTNGLSLDEFLTPAAAKKLVDSFLRIRPQGGRVWVDGDGDATTYVGGVLTYLGRLVDDSHGAGAADPPVGTPCRRAGRRYDVSRRGITRRPDGAQLEQVISSDQAKAVRKRLLSVRPSGGRFFVDAAGVAVTCLDGAWVFAGRVGPGEWFPGDVLS
jgi:hypothetical protein